MKCVVLPTQGDAKGVSVLGSSCNSNMTVDVVIVGAGPAGIFTALSLLKDAPSTTIALVEKGLPIERRNCPKAKVGHWRRMRAMSHYDGVFGRGRVFRWKAVALARGWRRPAGAYWGRRGAGGYQAGR